MPFINEILHGRTANFFVRHFGLRGPQRTQISPDVQGVIDTEANYLVRPDLAIEQLQQGFVGANSVGAGGAGTFAWCGIQNPSSSNRFAFGWLLFSTLAAAGFLGYEVMSSTALPGAVVADGQGVPIDGRQAAIIGSSVCPLIHGNTGTVAAAVRTALIPAQVNPTFLLWYPFVLQPGEAFIVLQQVAVTAILQTSYLWFERDQITPNE